MTKKSQIKFKSSELQSFVEDPKSCVKYVRRKQHLSILPWCLENLKQSVEETLNRKVAHYDKSLGGILLSARNITLLSPLGALRHDSPEIHIDIEADFYIFQPEIDSILEGVIVKKNDHFIGCLVHRVFNISIPKANENNWSGSYLEIGDNVTFKVIFMDLLGRLPYIRGEIDFSNMELEEMSLNESIKQEEHVHLKKPKKNKKTYFDEMEIDENQNEEIEEVDKVVKKSKKNKKHKNESSLLDEASDELAVMENSTTEEIKEKKSKKKKQKTIEEESEQQEDISIEPQVFADIKIKQEYSPKKETKQKSPVSKKSKKSKKDRTDSEGYGSENMSINDHENSNTKTLNKSLNESLNTSKRNSLVADLLSMVQSSMKSPKKEQQASRKRKHSIESPVKAKKIKKEIM